MTRRPAPDFSKGHPLVRALVDEMKAKRITVVDLEIASGVGHTALYNWCHGHSPNLRNIEACLNAVGLKLTVERAL